MPETTTWLEVSLVVDGEMAEAVAEVLARYARNGVVIESTGVTAKPDDSDGHAVGPLRVYGYLRLDETVEETRQKIEEGLYYLGRIRALPPAQFRAIQDTNWAEAWKKHYKPIAVGQKLMIIPAWLDSPNHERTPIRIDPGMAFGTGTHPSTQLCLEYVEELAGPELETVIDVGCGSGILAVAALKLGAGRALGVDIDPDSVSAAHDNARLNEVEPRFAIGLGSVAEILAGQYSPRRGGLVLANILAPVLISLFEDGLAELVEPGGRLVLSGIIEDQAPDVIAAAERRGLRLAGRKQEGDWVALLAAK